MTSKKQEFLTTFNDGCLIFKQLADGIFDAGGDDGDLRRLITDREVTARIAKIAVEASAKTYRDGDRKPGAKSEFLSAFGTAFEVFKALAQQVFDAGGDDLTLRRMMTGRLERQMAKELVSERSEILPERYGIQGRRDMDQAIKDGKYDWHDEKTIHAGYFPPPEDRFRDVSAVLVRMNHDAVDAMQETLRGHGLRAASLHELLGFGAAYHDRYKGLRVFALGTVMEGANPYEKDMYPVIEDGFSWGNAYRRRLSLFTPFQEHDYQRTMYLAVPR